MSTKSTENRLEKIAKELIDIAKYLECSIGLDVTKGTDGRFFGVFWKIGERAIDFQFDGSHIDFNGVVKDIRHLSSREEEL